MSNVPDDIKERLAVIETKLDLLISQYGIKSEDHESRIRAAEKKIWIFSGSVLSLSIIWDTIKSKIGG